MEPAAAATGPSAYLAAPPGEHDGQAIVAAAARASEHRDAVWRAETERIAKQAGEDLEDASAQEIVRWAAKTFGDRLCVTSSMADAVVAHLVSQVKPGVDVLFLDTGYHFAETLGTRDAVAAMYDVNVVNVTPDDERRAAGHRLRQGPVRPRPGPVLRDAQGRAADLGDARLRRLGHRGAPRRVALARATRRSSTGIRTAAR